MKKKLTLLLSMSLFCQVLVSQPYLNPPKEALVLKVDIEKNLITVDLLNKTKDFISHIDNLDEITLINEIGEVISPKQLSPGSKVHLIDKITNFVPSCSEIKILSDWEGESLKLEGILEYYDQDSQLATVAGRKALLDKDVVIEGKSKYKGDTFKSFSEITQGNFVTLFGTRQKSGVVLATRAFLAENEFSSFQQLLQNEFNSHFSKTGLTAALVPEDLKKYTDQLERGYAKFGDLKLKLLDNLEIQAYIAYVGHKLIPEWQTNLADTLVDKIEFKFYVIESPILNAYALPNGSIFIHSGLLEILENEAQLAAILSHEMAHITYEHSAERLELEETKKKIGMITKLIFKIWMRNENQKDVELAQVLDEDFYDGGVQAASGLVQAISPLSDEAKSALYSLTVGLKAFSSGLHSKKREEQADITGLLYMKAAGYNLMEASKVRKKVMDISGEKEFVENLEGVIGSWLERSDMYTQENPWNSLNIVVQKKVINRTKENWFCSHPLAIKRYRTTNYALASDYSNEDWETHFKGEQLYLEIMKNL